MDNILKRPLTQTEKLYGQLLNACIHYDGDPLVAFDKCKDLLKEVKASKRVKDDFKSRFEIAFYAQMELMSTNYKHKAFLIERKIKELKNG